MELCFAARAGRAPRPNRRAGACTVRCAVTAPAPMGEKTEYRDGPLERAFMGLFARKMEKFASGGGGKSKEEKRAVWDWDYESFVDVSRRVMVGRTRAQQQEAVREVLLSMLPPGAPEQFRKLFPPTRWACEFNAALTVPFFHWPVGGDRGGGRWGQAEEQGPHQEMQVLGEQRVRRDVRQHVQNPNAELLLQ